MFQTTNQMYDNEFWQHHPNRGTQVRETICNCSGTLKFFVKAHNCDMGKKTTSTYVGTPKKIEQFFKDVMMFPPQFPGFPTFLGFAQGPPQKDPPKMGTCTKSSTQQIQDYHRVWLDYPIII